MELGLSGQVCVVFGGASGIGRAIGEAFFNEGCRVGVVDLHEEAIRGLDQAERFQGHRGDVSCLDDVEGAREHFLKAFGRVDHVVVAAANSSGKYGFPYWNLSPADWSKVLQVTLMGSVNVAHVFGPTLAEQRSGTLLFLTSVAGQVGSQTDPPYSAAKAAVINFMQCAARDLAAFKVRVNALSPGMVKTSLNEAVWSASQASREDAARQTYEDWAKEKIERIAPLGEWQTPPEYGAMAAYLASDHARNITGQVLNIDGGQVMHA